MRSQKFWNWLEGFGLVAVVCVGFWLRWLYMYNNVGNPNEIDFGGDPSHHYNIAQNIYRGVGPFTDFIFSYWFRHPDLPAMTDVYPPGYHYLLAGVFHIFGPGVEVARWVSLLLGSLVPLLTFGLARHLSGERSPAPLLAAALVALNAHQVEYSALVMTPVVACFWFLLALYLILWSCQSRALKRWCLAGAVSGVAALTQGAGPALFVTGVVAVLASLGTGALNRTQALRALSSFVACYFFLQAPWGYMTHQYFGSAFFSVGSFYPLTTAWTLMNSETTAPSFAAFAEGRDWVEHFGKILNYVWRALSGQSEMIAFPAFPKPVSSGWMFFALVPFLSSGKLFVRRILAAIFCLGVVGMMALASYAMQWSIHPRHYFAVTAIFGIFATQGLWSFIRRGFGLIRHGAIRLWIPRFVVLVALVVFAHVAQRSLTSVSRMGGSFWSIEFDEFKELCRWIDKNTAPTARIFYASTPQDLSQQCRRQVVIDPSFGPSRSMARENRRIVEEMKFYGVEYLLVDRSDRVYDRKFLALEKIPEIYFPLRLIPLFEDARAGLHFYRIEAPLADPKEH